MLVCHGITRRFGSEVVLKDVNFSISRSDRVGLIGPNGSGKTTLLKILSGLDQPDAGRVTLSPKELRIGYLPQGLDASDDMRLIDVIFPQARAMTQAEVRLAHLAEGLANAEGKDVEKAVEAYDRALTHLTTLTSQVEVGHLESVLASLDLQRLPLDARIGELSGGQKTRVGLARVLIGNPQLLLLDEPTNHLDIVMLEWLETWLQRFDGGVLLVSHDRTFLDRTVDRILDLDPKTHSVRKYEGNYSDYLEQYLSEQAKRMSAYRDQVYEERRLRQDIARVKEQARRTERKTTDSSQRRYAKKVARKAKARERRLQRYLDADDRVERPEQSWHMALKFTEPQHLGSDVLRTHDLEVGYPGNEPLLCSLDLQLRAGERVAFTGPNGAGKSTLLRTFAGEIKPLGGTVHLGSCVRLGYMSQEQELLDSTRSALEIIRNIAPLSETDARSYLHLFLFRGDDPLRPAGELSYGERARLALAVLVARGSNFLLLDEPINHLDIPSRERFERALAEFMGTVIAVVHDRYFIERFATKLWVVEGRRIREEIQ